MKKTILNIVATGFITTAILAACDSPAEKVADAKDKVIAAKENVAEAKMDLKQSLIDSMAQVQSDSLTSWQKFKKESGEKIIDNKKRIAELKINIATATVDMKASYQKTVNDLELRNDNMKSRLTEYKDDKKEKLEVFKQRFNNDINEIANSLKGIKIK